MSFEMVTDTSCNLPNRLIDEYDLHIIPLQYYVGETAYDSYFTDHEPDFKAFYDMARKKESITTSLATPDACFKMFEPLLADGKDILYIGFSSALSGTFQVAHNCLDELSEKYPDRKIYSVDSRAACLGEGLLVQYAVKLKQQGKTIEEVYEWLMDNRLKLCHWFTVDDLFYLKRGGRVSGAAAVIGTILSVKPIMNVDDEGRLIVRGKAIGRKKAIETLADKMQEAAVNPAGQQVFIAHGDCIEDAEYLAKIIKERMGVKDILIHYVEPVIGAHSGPGTLALFFLGEKR